MDIIFSSLFPFIENRFFSHTICLWSPSRVITLFILSIFSKLFVFILWRFRTCIQWISIISIPHVPSIFCTTQHFIFFPTLYLFQNSLCPIRTVQVDACRGSHRENENSPQENWFSLPQNHQVPVTPHGQGGLVGPNLVQCRMLTGLIVWQLCACWGYGYPGFVMSQRQLHSGHP